MIAGMHTGKIAREPGLPEVSEAALGPAGWEGVSVSGLAG